MGDVDGGEAVLLLHLLQNAQNLRLNRDIESCRRLVADKNLGTAGDCDGDDHALAHAAGKFVRILMITALRFADADLAQQLEDAFLRFLSVYTLMELDGLLDLISDGFQRIEGGHGILHDHGNFAAADFQPVLIGLQLCQVLTVIKNGSAGDMPVRGVQPHERVDEDGLARAGFSDDGKTLSLVDSQTDAAQRVQHLAAERKFKLQITDREQRLL